MVEAVNAATSYRASTGRRRVLRTLRLWCACLLEASFPLTTGAAKMELDGGQSLATSPHGIFAPKD